MARVEFTDRWLKALKPNAGRRLEWWDARVPGLVVRVTPAGVASFAVRYRFNGQPRRLTLGRVGPLALADARRNTLKVLAKVSEGLDPAAVKKEKRAEAARRALRGDTFESLARRCLDAIAPQLKPRSLIEYRRALEHDVFPRLGKLRPETVTRGDVRALIQEVAKRAPVQGNRTYAAIRRVFGWALEQDLLPGSPCAGLKRPSEETHRERNFNNDEIRAIFEAISDTELEHLVALIFYTATRSHEARGARWEEFDLERRLWTVPAERRKMRKRKAAPLLLPLSRGALRALERMPRMGAYVFPAGTASGHMDDPNKVVQWLREHAGVAVQAPKEKDAKGRLRGGKPPATWKLRQVLKDFPSDFTLHLIRHTVRSRMTELGVVPDIGERCLGHAIGGIRGVYDQADFLPQVRAAFEAWSAALERIRGGRESDRHTVEVVGSSPTAPTINH
jgi:integrase